MSFKRTRVVMLSTNEKASLLLGTSTEGQLVKSNGCISNSAHLKNQHLYFLSDDEIKEGDWVLLANKSIVSRCIGVEYLNNVDEKKIIATTDKNLIWLDKSEKNPELARINGLWKCLPQPSESFLQKFIYAYNNGDPITEVMVEYKHLQSSGGLNEEWLKVNSSDNTITIRKMKDSWTREEVINLCREAINYGKDYNGNLSEKWIEYNL